MDLSLFQKTTLRTLFHFFSLFAGPGRESPECCAGAGNGDFLSGELVHEMSRIKKSYTVLPLLQNRLVD